MLSPDRWAHVVEEHAELDGLEAAVLGAVERPDRRIRGREPTEEWYYGGGVGPSRWIKVVVHYEGDVGRIVTAFPRRRFP